MPGVFAPRGPAGGKPLGAMLRAAHAARAPVPPPPRARLNPARARRSVEGVCALDYTPEELTVLAAEILQQARAEPRGALGFG